MIHDMKKLKVPTFDEFVASLPTNRKEGFSWSEVNEKERTYNFSFTSPSGQRAHFENVLFVGVRAGVTIDTHYVVTAIGGTLAVARIPFNPYTDMVSWIVEDGQPAFAL